MTGEQLRVIDDDVKNLIRHDLNILAKQIMSYEGIKNPGEISPPGKEKEVGKTSEGEIPYNRQMALDELFISEADFDRIVDAINYKKNIILQGPPGTGKTFLARRLAYAILGRKDHSHVEMIQFHQSYSYEDFIQGYRPTDGGHFELKNGIFYNFVKKAQGDQEHEYFFIIDEINRANLSKVFGELMMLIEYDKRGLDFALPLTYNGHVDDKFYIPKNLYLIGTMNTADRSITIVDYALRRRFLFITLSPQFGAKFAAELKEKGIDSTIIDEICLRIAELNEIIAKDDKNLGPGFQIGHSYFCPTEKIADAQTWYNRVIKLEIEPLLAEYWFDNLEKATEHVKNLYL